MGVACCPYCEGESFYTEVIRADVMDIKNPEAFFKSYGHWFNKCISCESWSLHKDGKQLKIEDAKSKPKEGGEIVV